MQRLVSLIVVAWLVIGIIAGAQRGYYGGGNKPTCSTFGDITITILAGPLNYVGVNPKVSCTVPQPSR